MANEGLVYRTPLPRYDHSGGSLLLGGGYIYIYLHTYIHTYVRTYVRACVHAYLPTYLPTYLHTYINIYMICTTRKGGRVKRNS